MGETRALGCHPDGRPWEVGLADPNHPERIMDTLPLADQAAATSGAYGFHFDAQGRFNHLLDPRTGRSAGRYGCVTVLMPTATAADALSTAFSMLSADDIYGVLKILGSGQAYLTTLDRRRIALSA